MERKKTDSEIALGRAGQALSKVFDQMGRNGRWGSCVACPESAGKKYPEFCEFTTRHDHRLTIEDLTFTFNVEFREQIGRLEREHGGLK